MKEIRETNKEYDSGIKVKDLIGEKVLASDGKEVGKIMEIRLNPKSYALDGIEIDRGFFALNTFVGRNYIESINAESTVLNIIPANDYKGFNVIDLNGKKVGKVKEIRTDGRTNNITAIVVGTGMGHNDAIFTKSDVKSVGDDIMLNSVFDEDAIKVGGREK